MKVAINKQHGGFGLSDLATEMYAEQKGIKLIKKKTDGFWRVDSDYMIDDTDYFSAHDLERNDSDLISVIEEFGDESHGWAASLRVVEIPDDVEWQIEEYDGLEWVAEKHRIWD